MRPNPSDPERTVSVAIVATAYGPNAAANFAHQPLVAAEALAIV
jgi:hypothetical protein